MTWSLKVQGRAPAEVLDAFEMMVSDHRFIPESCKPLLIEAAGFLLRAFPVNAAVIVSTSGRMSPDKQGRVGVDVGTDTRDL